MLYQGEDITLRISGDELVDFVNSNFVVLITAKGKPSSRLEIYKKTFTRVNDSNEYVYVIPHDTTKDMQGSYNIEILLEDSVKRRSIFTQENAFYIEYSNIKDVKLE